MAYTVELAVVADVLVGVDDTGVVDTDDPTAVDVHQLQHPYVSSHPHQLVPVLRAGPRHPVADKKRMKEVVVVGFHMRKNVLLCLDW